MDEGGTLYGLLGELMMGRPKGSKNKPKRGAPRGPRKNKTRTSAQATDKAIEDKLRPYLPLVAHKGVTMEVLVQQYAVSAVKTMATLEQLERIERLKYDVAARQKDYENTHRLEYFTPYDYQRIVPESFREGFNIVILPISNKVGKTRIGSALVHSWAIGYESWKKYDKEFKGAVKVGEYWYMPSSLGKKPPVKILISGEDWEEHAGETLVPELEFFEVSGEWEKKKNNVGVAAHWHHKPTGSEFRIMTYRQDKDLFESFKCDAWWPDEPPPQSIWSGMARALFMSGGKVFMSMTPLKEPWVFDDLVHAQRADVKTITNVTLWDAPHLYDNDLQVLMNAGLSEDRAVKLLTFQKKEAYTTKFLPETEAMIKELVGDTVVEHSNEFGQTFKTDGYTYVLQNLHIHRLIKELKDDTERLPRVFGEPKHLIGRVWKNFKSEKFSGHLVDDFDAPVHWPVDFQIDFHPSENIAISFRACDPYGRHFIIDEVWDHLTNGQIVDEIVKRVKRGAWRCDRGEIDALSKGDSAYVKNRRGVETEDSFYEIQRMLKQHNIKLGVGSKAEKNYIAKVDEWITNDPPLFFVQVHCHETIHQIERWVYEDNGKPSANGHFPECIGRFSQTGLKYTPMNDDSEEIEAKDAIIIQMLEAELTIPTADVA